MVALLVVSSRVLSVVRKWGWTEKVQVCTYICQKKE